VSTILTCNDFNIIIFIYFLVIDHILALRCIGLSLAHWRAILKRLTHDRHHSYDNIAKCIDKVLNEFNIQN